MLVSCGNKVGFLPRMGERASLGLKMVIFLRLKMDTPPWGVLNYPQKKLEFLSKSFFSEVLPGITTISRQKTSNKRAPRKMGKKNLPLG